jgi:N-acetyl-anhydromuramyl-L-alanine amidase AmpD
LIKRIFIHCSDSEWGNAVTIDEWHEDRGFDKIGYHYVILNDKPHYGFEDEILDGQISVGRKPGRAGAHVQGFNFNSLGICLIGIDNFTEKQMNTLGKLLQYLCNKHDLTYDDVYGHRDVDMEIFKFEYPLGG